jgi:molybdopterin/thiamine biosynthesis adenylyltransferase/rhodanese-related sulfurtransferase
MSLPPLVEPAADLGPDEVRRYARQVTLPALGVTGQRRLAAARVLVVGAGGLGSPVLLYLAAAGVGTIGVVDDDVVDLTNLHRQVVHGTDDVGRAKVDSAADAVAAVNPLVTVVRHRERLTSANALDVLRGYHLVVDGTDTFPTRYLVGDACTILGLPCVWGSVLRFDGQVSLFWADPPPGPDGVAEPGVTYRDLFPDPPPPGSVPSCAEGGVLGAVCAVVGSTMAAEALKLVTGTGRSLLGRLLVYEGLGGTWREIRVRPAGPRPVVTRLVDYDAFCGLGPGSAVRARPGDEVTATELAALLADRERGAADFVLVDVREPWEREIVAIPGAVPVPVGGIRSGEAVPGLAELAAGRRVVLHCKSGGRSAEALALLRAAGFADAAHLAGGVLAWVEDVDPGQDTY